MDLRREPRRCNSNTCVHSHSALALTLPFTFTSHCVAQHRTAPHTAPHGAALAACMHHMGHVPKSLLNETKRRGSSLAQGHSIDFLRPCSRALLSWLSDTLEKVWGACALSRSMLNLIHQVAPGRTLTRHTCFEAREHLGT